MSYWWSNSEKDYFSRQKLLLRFLGVSLTGNESRTYKIITGFFFVIFSYSYPFVAIGDLLTNDLNEVADTAAYFGGCTTGVLLTTALLQTRIKLGKLLKKLETPPFLPDPKRGGEMEKNVLKKWLTLLNILHIGLFGGGSASLAFHTVQSLVKRLSNSDYHDWVLGFGSLKNIMEVPRSPYFEILWCYQNICVYRLFWSVAAASIIVAGVLAFISIQFRFLQNSIRNIVENSHKKMQQNNEQISLNGKQPIDASLIPWKYLHASVKEVVSYHLSIINIAKEIEEIFSLTIFAIYLGSCSMLCFEVYRSASIQFSDVRMLNLLVEVEAICFLPLMVCYCGEQMVQEAEEVGMAAYECNFVGADVRFQKSLAIIMRRSQYPIRIKAGKFIDTSMNTFVWIVRAAYSICTLLRKSTE